MLIAEDDFRIASNLFTFLEMKGFAVDAVYSGPAAVHRCSVESFDLVLLDLGLPGIDGLSFLQRLRGELRSGVPVLVLSARSELADKLAGFAHGADDYDQAVRARRGRGASARAAQAGLRCRGRRSGAALRPS